MAQSVSKTESHAFTCIITGDVEHDRQHFKQDLLQNGHHTPRHFQLDIAGLENLNLLTLGLLAWMHEQIRQHGHSLEFVNTNETLDKALALYRLQ